MIDYFNSYSEFMPESTVIPKLYWGSYSQEQRIWTLCHEIAKMIKYAQLTTDKLNDVISIVNTLENELPELVNDDVKAEIERLVTTGEFAEMVQAAIETLTGEVTAKLNSLDSKFNDMVYPIPEHSDATSTENSDITIEANENYYSKTAHSLYSDISKTGGDQYDIAAFGIKRNNGSTLMPAVGGLPYAQSANINGILATMGGYLNRGITYGRDGGLFNDSTTPLAKSMVCSDFVWAAMMGLGYQSSKFAGDFNAQGQICAEMPPKSNWVNKIGPERKSAWITREIAACYANAGKLYKVSSIEDIRSGDILFSGTTEDVYLGIDHCAIVVDVFYELNQCTVVECGDNGYMSYNFTTGNTGTNMQPHYALISPFRNADMALYVARPNWEQTNPVKLASKSGIVAMTPTKSTQQLFDINNTESKIPQGSLIEIKLSGNFGANSNTSTSDYNRILVTEPSSIATPLHRLTRYYAESSNTIFKMPSTIILHGFVNAEIPINTNSALAVFYSSTKSNPVELAYELNVYAPC